MMHGQKTIKLQLYMSCSLSVCRTARSTKIIMHLSTLPGKICVHKFERWSRTIKIWRLFWHYKSTHHVLYVIKNRNNDK
jgi:hypothetical protein